MMFKPIVKIINLGRMNYMDALKIQFKYQTKLIDSVQAKRNAENYMIIVEHEPVYTVGIRSKGYTPEVEKYLRSLGADFHKISRGGLITFHGFGQLTVYPILYLGSFKTQKSIKKYVCMLEDVIVNTGRTILKDINDVYVSTIPEYPGVWINNDRKLAAIGINCKRFVTMHGVSLNCNINLDWFEHIVPCGIEEKSVTSLSRELGQNFTVQDATPFFLNSFKNVFKCDTIEVFG